MRGFEQNASGQGSAGYDVVRVVLALVLLTAAGLKAYQLATEPTPEKGLLTSRWFLIGVVEFELFFGLWLLSGLMPRLTWLAALGCFGTFSGVTMLKALSGAASCGCLGPMPVNPWYTFALDVAVVLSLIRWRPENRPFGDLRLRAAGVLGIWFVASLAAAYALGGRVGTALSDAGEIIGDGKTIVLRPETWVGKRFPLLPYIDIREQLAQGRFTVLIYRHDCPSCRTALERFECLARRSEVPLSASRIALVEMPPYARSEKERPASSSSWLSGRLTDEKEWFAESPIELALNAAVVSRVVVVNPTSEALH